MIRKKLFLFLTIVIFKNIMGMEKINSITFTARELSEKVIQWSTKLLTFIEQENIQETQTVTILPILAALQQIEDSGGEKISWENLKSLFSKLVVTSQTENSTRKKLRWNAINEKQKIFKDYIDKSYELGHLSPDELKSCASQEVAIVNKFLKDNNFSIEVAPLINPRAFAIAAIMKICCSWQEPGKKDYISYNNKQYDAVKMKKGYAILKSDNYNNPILAISTKNQDSVMMTIAHKSYEDFDLLHKIEEIDTGNKTDITENYKYAKFPMVNLDHKPDISWIKKMNTIHQQKYICVDQAVQQTKLKIDETGAIVESAVATSIKFLSKTIKPKKLKFVIDKPFYILIKRQNMLIPLFVGCIAAADWKRPNKN